MSGSINTPLVPEANAGEQSRMELQAKLNGLGGLSGRKLDPEAKAKKLREACEGFESIFIQKMWKEMRNTVPKSGLLSGREEQFWQDMYDQELSKSMTKAGGIGLADMMYEQLSRNLANASSQAAGSGSGQAFVPTAAPLVNPALLELEQAAEAPVSVAAASIYEGEAPATAPAPTPEAEQAPRVSPHVAYERKPQNLTHAASTTREADSATVSGVNSGIQQAYFAQRDAGDKLSAGAVRPAMRATKKPAQATRTEAAQAAPAAPGSAESLAQALELAKNGAGIQPEAQSGSYGNLVNEARARNALRDSLNAKAAQTMAAMDAEPVQAQPAVRKTRYTTNIPKSASAKKGAEAIRLLNVDNVSVNSKQGQGLAQWHTQKAAQDDAARATSATHPGGQSFTAPEPAQPISPLTAQDAAAANDSSYVIPPLKPGDLRG